MKTFQMNSLLGEDENGDVIITDETWLELNNEVYKQAFIQVKGDGAKELIRLTNLKGDMHLDSDSLKIHFVEYDVPAVIMESKEVCNAHFEAYNTPGLISDKNATDDRAFCYKIRLFIEAEMKCCLFPFIFMPISPPSELSKSPLLAHEMVHLRKTFSDLYNEVSIKNMFWNADLQTYTKNNLEKVLNSKIRTYLMEEWEACGVNHSDEMRNVAFTNIYLPIVMNDCASILDWWLNDEKLYLNIGQTAKIIGQAIESCLTGIGYNDTYQRYPMNPHRWGEVSERCLREAYKSWQKRPGDFVDKLRGTLEG